MRSGRRAASRHAPDLQLALGVAGVVLSGLAVHDHAIGPVETAVFRAVNRLPDQLYAPGWVVMQAGNVNAAPVAGVVALAAGRPRLAARITLTGLTTWALAKLIKHGYRRPRPASLIPGVRCRGKEASGLGYVSGHTGVAAGIAVAAVPVLRTPARFAIAAAVPVVGLCRMYVGAHLPLDVVGGAALGVAVDAMVSRLVPEDDSLTRRPAAAGIRTRSVPLDPVGAGPMELLPRRAQNDGVPMDHRPRR
jgi:membrane-associated phospholipid phosphatase